MKHVLVTGASHGIGKAITERLLSMDYEVHGIGRSFDEDQLHAEHFHAIVFDLLDTAGIPALVKTLPDMDVLVNNAGIAYYGLHEAMNEKKVMEMTTLDLAVPMILSRQLLPSLKKSKGTIINIASVTAEGPAPHAAAYGACKAGLLSFAKSLAAEVRKYDVRVTAILPDLTESELYLNADFIPGTGEMEHLDPEDTADAVEYVLSRPEHVWIEQLTVRPMHNRIEKKQQDH